MTTTMLPAASHSTRFDFPLTLIQVYDAVASVDQATALLDKDSLQLNERLSNMRHRSSFSECHSLWLTKISFYSLGASRKLQGGDPGPTCTGSTSQLQYPGCSMLLMCSLSQRLATAETGQPNETAKRSSISYGGMSTTADDVLDVLSNLLPFHLLIEKYRHQAAPARISHCINLNKWTP